MGWGADDHNVQDKVVERFDRAWWKHPQGDSHPLRLPREDMCQATGVAPEAR